MEMMMLKMMFGSLPTICLVFIKISVSHQKIAIRFGIEYMHDTACVNKRKTTGRQSVKEISLTKIEHKAGPKWYPKMEIRFKRAEKPACSAANLLAYSRSAAGECEE
jgi:hypothetical protein